MPPLKNDRRVITGPPLEKHLRLLHGRIDSLTSELRTYKSANRSPTVPIYDPEMPLDAVDGQVALKSDDIPFVPKSRRAYYFENDGWHPLNVQRFLPVVFDGVGAELTPGVWGDVPVHFNGELVRWRLVSIDSGDLQVDVWKADYASFPPTVADTITGSDQPLLAGTDKNESTALTGWTTELAAGDVLRFNIDSVSGITKATLTLTIET